MIYRISDKQSQLLNHLKKYTVLKYNALNLWKEIDLKSWMNKCLRVLRIQEKWYKLTQL